jgi:hypothetical protein
VSRAEQSGGAPEIAAVALECGHNRYSSYERRWVPCRRPAIGWSGGVQVCRRCLLDILRCKPGALE